MASTEFLTADQRHRLTPHCRIKFNGRLRICWRIWERVDNGWVLRGTATTPLRATRARVREAFGV